MVLVPAGVLDRIMHGPPQVSLARPDVLVVSANASDQTAVSQTVRPRGYTVRSASSVDAGRSSLGSGPERIGIVVIDGDMAGAKRLIGEVKATCPAARVIVLSGARDAGEISSRLVDAGVN
jgi:DNA-binding NtrC family response regulator